MHPAVQRWTVESSVTHLHNYISQLDVAFEDIQRYLVYRIPGAAEPVTVLTPSAPVQELSVHTEQIEPNATPEVKKCVFTINSKSEPCTEQLSHLYTL